MSLTDIETIYLVKTCIIACEMKQIMNIYHLINLIIVVLVNLNIFVLFSEMRIETNFYFSPITLLS